MAKEDVIAEIKEQAKELAAAYFTAEDAKARVRKLLGQYGLDESVIEAEAFRRTARELELIDRMLATLESRRDRIIRNISEYRAGLAQQLKESSNRILERGLLRLENTSKQMHSAAG
jgi:hypothetical protein